MKAEIIPFGKYKGQPIEVLRQDKEYLGWLQNQDWFKNRYQNINNLIINNFGEPSETPEHNLIQSLFTDNEFCIQFITHTIRSHCYRVGYGLYKFKEEIWYYEGKEVDLELKNKYFESFGGIDVVLEWKFSKGESWDVEGQINSISTYKNAFSSVNRMENGISRIEIKPNLSDDYPSVLRQMMANKSTILFCNTYSGSVELEKVRDIFECSRRYIILKSDL